MRSIFHTFKSRTISERILIALSALLFVFVIPPTILRFKNEQWPIFFLDSFLVLSALVILINTFRQNFISFLKFYMCLLVCGGASITAILGGIEQIYWLYPATLTAYFLVKRLYAFFFLMAMSLAVLPTILASSTHIEIMSIYMSLFGTAAFINVFSKEVLSENQNLLNIIAIDHLTGVGNRRSFEMLATDCLERSQTQEQVSSLIVLDIDDFKLLNDAHGHVVGDQILKGLCHDISKRFGNIASVFRIGGEEFAIILPTIAEAEALQVAQLIRFIIANENGRELPRYTLSIGIASSENINNLEEWLEHADLAMYESKKTGKDKITLWSKLSAKANKASLLSQKSSEQS